MPGSSDRKQEEEQKQERQNDDSTVTVEPSPSENRADDSGNDISSALRVVPSLPPDKVKQPNSVADVRVAEDKLQEKGRDIMESPLSHHLTSAEEASRTASSSPPNSCGDIHARLPPLPSDTVITPQSTTHRATTGFRPARAMTAFRRARYAPGAYHVRGSPALAPRRRNANAAAAATGAGRLPHVIGWTGGDTTRINNEGAAEDPSFLEVMGGQQEGASWQSIPGFTVDTETRGAQRSGRTIRPSAYSNEDIPVIQGVAIVETSEHQEGSASPQTTKSTNTWIEVIHHRKASLLIILFLFGALVAILVGVLVFGRNDGDHNGGKSSPSPSSSSSSARFNEVKSVLESYADISAFEDTSSPQHAALVWIADEDERMVNSLHTQSILQRFALATLYFATGGEQEWHHQCNFLASDHECSWHEAVPEYGRNSSRGEDAWTRYIGSKTDSNGLEFPFKGVFCSENSLQITHITMPMNNLQGNLPEEIGFLSSLTHIGLWSNDLTGPIPWNIGNLEGLGYLILDENRLSEAIPSSLWYLSDLRELSIPYNSLRGSITSSIGNLINLKHFDLGFNFLGGTLLSDLGALPELESLDLRGNFLSGTLPPELGNLSSLKRLYLGALANVPASCIIYYELRRRGIPVVPTRCDVAELGAFYLGGTYFQGEIPATLGNLRGLEELELSRHMLNGTIPLSFQNLTSLNYLSLDYNMLTGPIPSELSELTRLGYVSLWSNLFTGTIPSELRRLTGLGFMSLWGNLLSGSLPSELSELTNMTFLSFWSNRLNGTVPLSYQAMTSLVAFAVNNNSITGNLDFLCNLPLLNLVADCYGDSPEVECNCCNYCCSDDLLGDTKSWFVCFENVDHDFPH